MRRTRLEREALACRRLVRVLARHGVANSRTLEQKISDAGPGDQRVDPHVLKRCDYATRTSAETHTPALSGLPHVEHADLATPGEGSPLLS